MPRYVVVVREAVEQEFLVDAPTGDAAEAYVVDLGFGHDGCVDWSSFIATEQDENPVEGIEVVEISKDMITRTVRRPRRLNP